MNPVRYIARDIVNNVQKKEWVFSGFLIGLGFLSWLFLFLALNKVYLGWGVWLAAVVFLLFLSSAIGLSFFLLRPKALAIVVYIILGASVFVFFGAGEMVFIGVFGLILFVLFGYVWIRREEELLVKFLYRRLIIRGMPIFFTGLSLLLAFLYNSSASGAYLESPRIPEAAISVLLMPIEYPISGVLPGFSKNMTISELEKLNPIVKTFTSSLAREEKEGTIVEFTHEFLNFQLEAIIAPYRKFLPIVFILGLFFVFKAISMPFMWASIGIGWLVTKILLRVKIISIKTVSAEREMLVL